MILVLSLRELLSLHLEGGSTRMQVDKDSS